MYLKALEIQGFKSFPDKIKQPRFLVKPGLLSLEQGSVLPKRRKKTGIQIPELWKLFIDKKCTVWYNSYPYCDTMPISGLYL